MKKRNLLSLAGLMLFVAAGLLGVPSVFGQEEQPLTDLTGTWEGEIRYANGWRGRVDVTLEKDGKDRFTGTTTITIFDEEDKSVTEGTANVRLREDRLLSVDVRMGGKKKTTIQLDGRVTDAMPYAEASLYGSFQGKGPRNPGGVFILWRFRE